MKDFRFRRKICFQLVIENSGSVVQSPKCLLRIYKYRGSFPNENFFAKRLMSYTFLNIEQIISGFRRKISAGFQNSILRDNRSALMKIVFFEANRCLFLKKYFETMPTTFRFWAKKFGSVVETALSNSRQNFDESNFLENSEYHSKFLTLIIYNHRHLAWKIYRQGFQNCIVRVQTLF